LNNIILFKRIFQKKNLLPKVLLSRNRLLEGSNRLLVANILFKLIYKAVIDYHGHVIDYQCFKALDFKFQESQLVIKQFQTCVIDYTIYVIDYQCF